MPTSSTRPVFALLAAAAVAGSAFAPAAAWAQAKPQALGQGSIFTCTSATGSKFTSDRPIPECLGREQRVLNKDGSLRQILMPSLTPDERAAAEEGERRKVELLANRQEAMRRDRNLLARYPGEPAHRKAREAALAEVREGTHTSQKRLADLEKERSPLAVELQFYEGKTVPAKLRAQLDAIDASVGAQRALIANQQVEFDRVSALFDAERQRLKLLWTGTAPGSTAAVPQIAEAAASGAAATKKR